MSRRLRFAVVTLGSLGDLHPFLAVARALAERGHDVHLLSQAPHEVAVRAEGVGFRPIASATDHERTLNHPLLWHPLHGFGVLWRHLAVPSIGPTLEALDALAGAPAQGPLVVFASPLAVGARLAAERWSGRVRLVSGYTAPMGLRSTADPMFLGGWQVPRWVPQRARWALWAGLDRWKLEPMAHSALALWRQRLGLGAPGVSTFGDWLHAPAGGVALYPDWFAAVPRPWRTRKVHQVGFPIFEPTSTPFTQQGDLAEFLSDDSPYMVAYPGSADQRAQSFANRVVAAGQAVGLRTLVLSRFASPDQSWPASGALRVEHAPLHVVLKNAQAFVHHGGIGSTAQALRARMPQLVLASSYDQFENGARLSMLGAGRWGRESAASVTEIGQHLQVLIQGCASDRSSGLDASVRERPNSATSRSADLLELMQDQFSLPGIEGWPDHV